MFLRRQLARRNLIAQIRVTKNCDRVTEVTGNPNVGPPRKRFFVWRLCTVAIRVGINGFGRIGRMVFRAAIERNDICLLYTSPSPRDRQKSRMPSSA